MTFTDQPRVCQSCGAQFTFTAKAQARGKKGRFCSRVCSGHGITHEGRQKGLEIVRANTKSPEKIQQREAKALQRKLAAAQLLLENNGYTVEREPKPCA